jgi:hypothetical protein
MPKYAMVRFRGKEMRVGYRPSFSAFACSPNAEVEWWFADLTAQEREQLYVAPREKVAILRQIRHGGCGDDETIPVFARSQRAGFFLLADD